MDAFSSTALSASGGHTIADHDNEFDLIIFIFKVFLAHAFNRGIWEADAGGYL